MHTDLIFLIGAGGHCKVVMDALMRAGTPRSRLQIRDESAAASGRDLLGCAVGMLTAADEIRGHTFHLTIGAAQARQRLHAELTAAGGMPLSIAHPLACISPDARLEAGVFVAAYGVVAPAALVGCSVIVNHGAIVDHDCAIGDFCHIAPNATLGGGVKLGHGVMVGAGAVVLPGLSVGDGAVIGAGAVVTRNVPAGGIWAGVPARQIKSESR